MPQYSVKYGAAGIMMWGFYTQIRSELHKKNKNYTYKLVFALLILFVLRSL